MSRNNSNPIRLYPNILIIQEGGEWYDRYFPLPLSDRPDAIIQRVIDAGQGSRKRHSGAEVDETHWQQALDALTGRTTYDGEALKPVELQLFEDLL